MIGEAAVPNVSNRCSMRCTRSWISSIRRRAAANSIARGSPSNFATSCSTSSSIPSTRKVGSTAIARSTNIVEASDRPSVLESDKPGMASVTSPGIPNARRLVVITRIFSPRPRSVAMRDDTSSTTCSQLSRTKSACLSARLVSTIWPKFMSGGLPTPIAPRISAWIGLRLVTAASSTSQAPSPKR